MKQLSEDHKNKIAEALRKGNSFHCITCGNEFWRKPSAIKRGDNKFCSKTCYFEWQRGRPRSAEFSEKCKGRVGDKNPNWRGGKTPEGKKIRASASLKEWVQNVFKRDNWTCQKCGARSSKNKYVRIEAHHIKPFAAFPKLRIEVSNGITLCKECHDREPKGKAVWNIS